MTELSDQIRKREERKKKESDDFHRRVGENLRRLREKKNYTQEYLAEVIGKKAYTSYGKMETGDIRLGIEDASILSRLYNISIEQLLNPQAEDRPSFSTNEERVDYPPKRNVVEISIKLDGTEVELVKQIELLQSINKVLSER